MTQVLTKPVAELNEITDFLFATATGDDKGIRVEGGQFSVGTPNEPHESVFGGGDSYPVDYAWHVDYSNISGLTVTGATDVATVLKSDTESWTGLFDGTTAGKCLLLMTDVYPNEGAKAKIKTPGDVDPDSLTVEYLQDNSPTWVQTLSMASDAENLDNQFGASLASNGVLSEQWRFGANIIGGLPIWNQVTMNVNGTDYTGWWSIIRLTGSITSDPEIEQLKLHTNRVEANANGAVEYFGFARRPIPLNITWETTIQEYGFSPSNESVPFAPDLTLAYTDNEFSASATDGRGGIIIVPKGMDTSLYAIFSLDWYGKSDTAGDIYFEFAYTRAKIGEKLSAAPNATTTTETISVGSGEATMLKRTQFRLSFENLVPGEKVAFAIRRRGGDAQDTYPGTMVFYDIRAEAFAWR